jgi:putative membrane protein
MAIRIRNRAERARIKLSLSPIAAALALTGLAGCHSNDRMQPQTPQSMTTTTTSAPVAGTPEPANEPINQYGEPATTPTPTGTSAGTSTVNATAGTTSGTTPAAGSDVRPGSSETTSALNDNQIAAVLNTASSGEIEQAGVAVKRAKEAKVRHFAEKMMTDHRNALRDVSELARKEGFTPEASETSQTIASRGRAVMSNLSSASSASFDRTYMDAQIDEHQTVLDTIEARLIPSAKDVQLRATLERSRDLVAAHLKMAKEIADTLKK